MGRTFAAFTTFLRNRNTPAICGLLHSPASGGHRGACMSHQVEVPSAAALIVAVVLAAPAAAAPPRDPAAAEWLFREGRTLMKKRDFLGACPKLEESLRLDPAVGTLMNLAECEERIGRTASAWQRWGAAADELPARDRRRQAALSRARSLEMRLARLSITL